MEACEVPNTFEGLRSFILLDQLKSSVSSELRKFLKENNMSNLDKAAELADIWSSAHGSYPRYHDASDKGKRIVSPKVTTREELKIGSPKTKKACHACGEAGHIRSKCPKIPSAFNPSVAIPGHSKSNSFAVNFCWTDNSPRDFTTSGTVNGSWVSTILRDSGCSCIIVSEQVLPDADTSLCDYVSVADYLGHIDRFPVVRW